MGRVVIARGRWAKLGRGSLTRLLPTKHPECATGPHRSVYFRCGNTSGNIGAPVRFWGLTPSATGSCMYSKDLLVYKLNHEGQSHDCVLIWGDEGYSRIEPCWVVRY